MTGSDIAEFLDTASNECQPKILIEALVEFLTDDPWWTHNNITGFARRNLIELAGYMKGKE